MKNKRQSLESGRETNNWVEESLKHWQSSSSTVGPRPGQPSPPNPPPPPRSDARGWCPGLLLHGSGCSTSPPVQRRADGASGLVQRGGGQSTVSHHRVSLSVVSGVGARRQKEEDLQPTRHKKVGGSVVVSRASSTCLLQELARVLFILFSQQTH